MCVALVIQDAKRMRHIISSVACLAVPYFSWFINGTVFAGGGGGGGGGVFLKKIYIFFV
jgi:hypothetical protein